MIQLNLKRLKTYTLILGLFFSLSSYSQWKHIEDINISPENYITNFKQINTIVLKNYSHLESKKINIDFLYKDILQKIDSAKTKQEYFNTLSFYFSELKNSHSRLFLNDYGINCSAELIENKLFLDRVFDKHFIENGLKKGDEIIKIDSLPSIEWLHYQKEFVNASTEKGDLNSTALFKVFSDIFKVTRTYEIKTSSGIKQIEIQLEKPADYSHLFFLNQPKTVGKMLNDNTAYIDIKSMTGSVVKDFVKVYNTLKDSQNLIIDLRKNTGGNSGLSEQILTYLIHEPQRACVSRKKIRPAQTAYKGSIYVLIGVQTGSAAESFALDLLESDNAILVGSPTNGDTGNSPRVFNTDFGVYFSIPTRKPAQISFKGFPMEGTGIPPHHLVNQTEDDYKNKIDTVLEYTLKLIMKS